VCIKIVAECKEEMLLEAVAIQDAWNRLFLYIQYPYLMKLDQKREKDQRSGLICERSHQGFLQSRVSNLCKNLEIFMACIFFSISSGKLEIVKILHKTSIWDKLEAI